MIRVTVTTEIVRASDSEVINTLTGQIWNDTPESPQHDTIGDYKARFDGFDGVHEVKDFPRLDESAWELLRRSLNAVREGE